MEPKNFMMDIKVSGRKVKAILDLRGMDQADLVRKSGVDKAFVSMIVNEKRGNATFKTLAKIGKALDIESDRFHNLFDPQSDPEAIIKKEKQSIVVPYLFPFSDLTEERFRQLESTSYWKRQMPSLFKFISLPKKEPFDVIEGQRYIFCRVDIKTNMSPKVEFGDILFINLDDLKPEEKKIYIILHNDQIRFRYAKKQIINNKTFIKSWAEDRSIGEDLIPVGDDLPNPILGSIWALFRVL